MNTVSYTVHFLQVVVKLPQLLCFPKSQGTLFQRMAPLYSKYKSNFYHRLHAIMEQLVCSQSPLSYMRFLTSCMKMCFTQRFILIIEIKFIFL